jgi:hypothetical protein
VGSVLVFEVVVVLLNVSATWLRELVALFEIVTVE